MHGKKEEATAAAIESSTSTLSECPLCLLEIPNEAYPNLNLGCGHRACFNCYQQYLRIEISESRVNITCPECMDLIHPNDIRMLLNDEVFLAKYEMFMLRRVLAAEPDSRWCPAPDCTYVVIAAGCASCPKLRCQRPGCQTSFCYHCQQEWHPNQTCDAARTQRHHRHNNRHHGVFRASSFRRDSIMASNRDDIKPCPVCKVLIVKMDDGSCNHMTCGVCGTEFCWLCMKEISDLHYLSPSGCTFWGKKPWSRKKKIMWQLGMLVGAPVGIALIAGIAVPAIIIGVPVWVGRKLHSRLARQARMSKHRRNMLITSSVITSIFISPVLAAVAVGIGVPILLAYVYGVVPISLCRSGGCGVTTSPTGVRLEMDEEQENNISVHTPPEMSDGLSMDTALSAKGVNPSIGEVSLGMSASVSMGSGQHLDDKLNGMDKETASNAALAGSIASATVSCAGAHRMDLQSEMSYSKRCSVSSHSETASATISFSEKSGNVSLADDISTKALAGSIVSYRDVCIGTNIGQTPVEVHIYGVSGRDSGAGGRGCGQDHEPCCCDEVLSTNSATNKVSQSTEHCSLSSSNFRGRGGGGRDGINDHNYLPPSSPRCVTFTTSSMGGKYESRSLEHLNHFCDLCYKTHRPCCPNYGSGSRRVIVHACQDGGGVSEEEKSLSKKSVKNPSSSSSSTSSPSRSVSELVDKSYSVCHTAV